MLAQVRMLGCSFAEGVPQWNYMITAECGLVDFVWQSDMYLEDGQTIDTPDECWTI